MRLPPTNYRRSRRFHRRDAGYTYVVSDVHICPGCGYRVEEGHEFLVAQEFQNAPGFGQRDFEPEALARGALRRFHVGHLHKRIGDLVFQVVDDERSALNESV